MNRPAPSDDGQDRFLWIILGLSALPVTNWIIGHAATVLGRGHLLKASVSDAFIALAGLPRHLGDPRQAWPPPAAAQLPGPVAYWLATALVLGTVIAGIAVTLARLGRRRHEPIDRRRRLGVEAQARLAATRDLRPVLARRPEPGRFVIGRWGRRPLCTEATALRGRRGSTAVTFLAPSILRQMPTGDALLIHGGLPPAWVRGR